jgi:tetratricopeptide (TPR) repeat protein
MARKLSEITRYGAALVLLTGSVCAAPDQAKADEAPVAASAATVIQNPFARQKAGPPNTKGDTLSPARRDSVFRNPFADHATAPPMEGRLLPGPVSRWRRPAAPLDESSAVRTAILTADLLEEIPRSADPPDPARFAATRLVQPAWLAADAQPLDAESTVGRASFNEPLSPADSTPIVATDLGESPEDLLAQAQQAATTAHSLEELTAVASLCQRAIAGNPSVQLSTNLRRLAAWAHNLRGEQLADADQLPEALAAFELAIAIDATSSLAIHNRAVTLAQQNQLQAALRDFNRVIELNPGLAVAYRNRAEALAALGRLNEAAADYSRAIERLPEDAELHAARGYAWQRLGDFDRAQGDYDRALAIAPDHPPTLAQRGNLAAEHGDYRRAIADFQRAIAIDPKCADAQRSLAWLLATCPDEQFRDAELALSAASTAVELSSTDDFLALEALAAANAASSRFDDAVRYQTQAIAAASPELATLMRQRLALYEAGQPFRNLAVLPRSPAPHPNSKPRSP